VFEHAVEESGEAFDLRWPQPVDQRGQRCGHLGGTEREGLCALRAEGDVHVLVSMHHSGGAPAVAWHAAAKADLLGPNTNVVHGAGLDEHWLRDLAGRGVTFTTTPESELRLGPDAPILPRLRHLGAAPSLGTDVDAVVPGEILSAARILLAYQRSVEHAQEADLDRPLTTARQALSWATVEGARALSLSDRVGRLAPGMQADLVVIDTTAPNLWPAHDPLAAALHANAGNIEAVMIAGRWRKRDHTLLDVDMHSLRHEVAASGQRLVRHLDQG
jgi:5-methylthioadenosine/S-adenosylhomocysteine deaminase